MGKVAAYSLLITLILSFGLATDVSAKSKRQKRIVQITLAPKKPSAKKKRPKRSQPVVVKHKRDHETVVEPLKKGQKVSNLGIQKIWKKSKKKKKKRSLASKAANKKKVEEQTEDESQIKDNDLNEILKNMKNLSETELISEYEGSL